MAKSARADGVISEELLWVGVGAVREGPATVPPEEEETIDIDRGREGFLRAAAAAAQTEMKERAFGSGGSQATEVG